MSEKQPRRIIEHVRQQQQTHQQEESSADEAREQMPVLYRHISAFMKEHTPAEIDFQDYVNEHYIGVTSKIVLENSAELDTLTTYSADVFGTESKYVINISDLDHVYEVKESMGSFFGKVASKERVRKSSSWGLTREEPAYVNPMNMDDIKDVQDLFEAMKEYPTTHTFRRYSSL